MNTYEQKQADRRERMAARVDRLRAYAAREYDKADLRGAYLDFSSWPLWCGSLDVKIDTRLQRQLVFHALAVSPEALALATPELLEFANCSHVVMEYECKRIAAD